MATTDIKAIPELDKLLRKYGQDFLNILTRDLIEAGKNSTGTLIKSLQADLVKVAEGISIAISSEEYLTYVDQGRKPGSFPPIVKIKEWCRLKNIPESASYAIAKSIYKNGIKPTHVIDKATKEFVTKVTPEMEKDLAPIIEQQIVKMFQDIK